MVCNQEMLIMLCRPGGFHRFDVHLPHNISFYTPCYVQLLDCSRARHRSHRFLDHFSTLLLIDFTIKFYDYVSMPGSKKGVAFTLTSTEENCSTSVCRRRICCHRIVRASMSSLLFPPSHLPSTPSLACYFSSPPSSPASASTTTAEPACTASVC
jgi:hypothetical protein